MVTTISPCAGMCIIVRIGWGVKIVTIYLITNLYQAHQKLELAKLGFGKKKLISKPAM